MSCFLSSSWQGVIYTSDSVITSLVPQATTLFVHTHHWSPSLCSLPTNILDPHHFTVRKKKDKNVLHYWWEDICPLPLFYIIYQPVLSPCPVQHCFCLLHVVIWDRRWCFLCFIVKRKSYFLVSIPIDEKRILLLDVA